MRMTEADNIASLGADLRTLRKARGLTLSGLAGRLGRSVGWLSQVERDMSRPSATDLRRIAKALEVPASLLVAQGAAPAQERGYIVRTGARRVLGAGVAGLSEELLSPDLTDAFEVIHSTFQPGARLDTPNSRPTQEVAHVISGRLDIVIASRQFSVGPGDSFRLRGEPYKWHNPHDVPAMVIWVIAPPVYEEHRHGMH